MKRHQLFMRYALETLPCMLAGCAMTLLLTLVVQALGVINLCD